MHVHSTLTSVVTGVDSSAKEVIGQLEISLDGLSLINAL